MGARRGLGICFGVLVSEIFFFFFFFWGGVGKRGRGRDGLADFFGGFRTWWCAVSGLGFWMGGGLVE